mmetsp:Transcript_25905/g.48615  ORF Transcript_25905/g.48615 Transcript_25905/m.48615 type:complete len:224 (+) Transcript_25905:808-1479(+)
MTGCLSQALSSRAQSIHHGMQNRRVYAHARQSVEYRCHRKVIRGGADISKHEHRGGGHGQKHHPSSGHLRAVAHSFLAFACIGVGSSLPGSISGLVCHCLGEDAWHTGLHGRGDGALLALLSRGYVPVLLIHPVIRHLRVHEGHRVGDAKVHIAISVRAPNIDGNAHEVPGRINAIGEYLRREVSRKSATYNNRAAMVQVRANSRRFVHHPCRGRDVQEYIDQ